MYIPLGYTKSKTESAIVKHRLRREPVGPGLPISPALPLACSRSRSARRAVAFEEPGIEAIYEFEVEDMPVAVAVDSKGKSVHEAGPKEWWAKLSELGLGR
jgi:hypothetical protein